MPSRTPFRKPYKKRKLKAEINVVPYIDVMLVLLVIFMVTAPLLSQGVKIELPEADAKEMPAVEQEPVVISIDQRGLIRVNIGEDKDTVLDESAAIKKVQAILAQPSDQPATAKKREVYLQADKDTRYQQVMSIMAGLQSVGVEGVGFLTQPVTH